MNNTSFIHCVVRTQWEEKGIEKPQNLILFQLTELEKWKLLKIQMALDFDFTGFSFK